MKVLHVVHAYYPARGGTEFLFQQVSEKLVADYGDQVTVITTNGYNPGYFVDPDQPSIPIQDHEEINGVAVRRFPVYNRTDAGAIVEGSIDSVNGLVSTSDGTRIEGGVLTVNGPMKLTGTTVSRDLRTVNADIELRSGSVIHGDLVIVRKRGIDLRNRPLEIELFDGSIVEGDVRVESDVEVRVLLHGGSKILGHVENAEVVQADAA